MAKDGLRIAKKVIGVKKNLEDLLLIPPPAKCV
jgi:hypothetical protein